MRRFANRLEARLKAAETAAGRLTPALLAKAFREELVPQDPDDEPASELLRRLAESRAQGAGARAGQAGCGEPGCLSRRVLVPCTTRQSRRDAN